MSSKTKVLIPDIGEFAGVEVIEVLVAPGDRVEVRYASRGREFAATVALMQDPALAAAPVQTDAAQDRFRSTWKEGMR